MQNRFVIPGMCNKKYDRELFGSLPHLHRHINEVRSGDTMELLEELTCILIRNEGNPEPGTDKTKITFSSKPREYLSYKVGLIRQLDKNLTERNVASCKNIRS